MNNIMKLLKPLSNPSMLTSYEKFYIQTFHQENKLIPEQYPGEQNPLFQTAIHPRPTTWKDQSCYSLRSGNSSILPALKLPSSSNSRYVQYLSFFSITLINTPTIHRHANQLPPKETSHTQVHSSTLLRPHTWFSILLKILKYTFHQPWSLGKKLQQKKLHLIHTTNTKTYTNATSYIFKEPDGARGNQRYRRELLTMSIMVPETCWA